MSNGEGGNGVISKAQGVLRLLRSKLFGGLRSAIPVVMGVAFVVSLVVLVVNQIGGAGDSKQEVNKGLTPADSSWVPGQPSLLAESKYLPIAGRAQSLAKTRHSAFKADLLRREAEREAARKRLRDEAKRRFEEAKRRAEARYQAALRRAREQRARQQRELEARKRRLAALRAELEKKRRIDPGEECELPEVRRAFNCLPGKQPLGKK